MPGGIPTQYYLQRLALWLEAETGLSVMQPDQGTFRPDLPYLGLSTLPGTWDSAYPMIRNWTALPVAWTLEFAGVDGTDPAALRIDSETIEVGPALATTDARDAWLTAFGLRRLAEDGWVTAAAAGATSITLSTSSGWAPPEVEALQGITLSSTTTVETTTVLTPIVRRYRLQSYGSTRDEADEAIAQVRSSWWADPPPYLRAVGAPTSLSIRSGADLDARTFCDIEISGYHLSRRALTSLAGATFAQTALPDAD